MSPEEVLDELERRIRHQSEAAAPLSMEWRAHMADLAHINALRRELEDESSFLGEHRVIKKRLSDDKREET